MDYNKMVSSSKKYIDSKEKVLDRAKKHLKEHPKDYQSKISYLLNKSQLAKERRKLNILKYQSKIQKYTEE